MFSSSYVGYSKATKTRANSLFLSHASFSIDTVFRFSWDSFRLCPATFVSVCLAIISVLGPLLFPHWISIIHLYVTSLCDSSVLLLHQVLISISHLLSRWTNFWSKFNTRKSFSKKRIRNKHHCKTNWSFASLRI